MAACMLVSLDIFICVTADQYIAWLCDMLKENVFPYLHTSPAIHSVNSLCSVNIASIEIF